MGRILPTRWTRRLLAVLAVSFVGCAHGSAGTGSKQVALAQRCPALEQARSAHTGPFQHVFIEAADLTHAGISKPEAWLDKGNARMDAIFVGGTIAEDRERTLLPWMACDSHAECADDQKARVGRWTLQFTTELPSDRSEAVKLSGLRLTFGDKPDTSAGGLDIATHDQRPVVVRLPNPEGDGTSVLSITPYLIASERELDMLLECKRRNVSP